MASFQTVIAFHVWKMGEVKRMDQARMDMHTSTDGEGRRTTCQRDKRAREEKEEPPNSGCGRQAPCVGHKEAACVWKECAIAVGQMSVSLFRCLALKQQRGRLLKKTISHMLVLHTHN